MKKNIVLCGFKGAGKTTFGKSFSLAVKRPFFDTDNLCELFHLEDTGEDLAYAGIYSRYGEAYFRQLEEKAVSYVSALSGVIIACGGSTVLNQQNVEMLKQSGIIVFLDVALECIKKRLQKLPSFLSDGKLEEIWDKRLDVYARIADFRLDMST